MKTRISLLLTLMLLVCACSAATAQEYVSVAELHDQAQAMGGVWQETFDTPSGEMAVDVKIEVPDIEKLPVITVEKAKMSEELFDQIRQGKKGGDDDEHQYEVELNGKEMEFFLGRDNYYVYGEQTDNTGYDAIQTLWIQHGDFRFSVGTGLMQKARPITYHDIEDVDMDKAYMRGSDQTVNDIMRLWQEDIELCLGEGFVIKPTNIEVKGSTIIKSPGKDKVYKRNGYTYVYAQQYIEGLPVFGAMALQFSVPHVSTQATNRVYDRLRPYRIGVDHCRVDLTTISSNNESYRTMTDLVKVRTVEQDDIPVASLESVLDAIAEEIEAGRIHNMESIRLGYILYSNPDMTDYAWAVPHWVVDCEYVSDDMKSDYVRYKKKTNFDAKLVPTIEDESVLVYTGEDGPNMSHYSARLPIDVQTGEPIVFTTGDEKVFSVPEIITWDDV